MHSPVQHVATGRHTCLLLKALRKRRTAHTHAHGEGFHRMGCAWVVMDELQHRTDPRIGERCYRSAQRPALNLCSQDMNEHHIRQLVGRNLSTTLRHSPLQFTVQDLLSLDWVG